MSVIVGIPVCATFDNETIHRTPARYALAVMGGAGALPVLIPPVGEDQTGILDHIHGLLVPGSPSNVHPSHYGPEESQTPDRHDPERDATTLPLIRAAIARGVPVLAICRGIQELNVALGGTLFQRVHELPGRIDHRGLRPTMEERYSPAHPITVTGALARIVGAPEIIVNSRHGQAIDRLGAGLVAEAHAPDGTIEAVAFPLAPGFVLGLQWHPEWRFAERPASVAIFGAFGEACRAYQQSPRKAA